MRTQVLELVRPMIARLPSGAASPVQTPPAAAQPGEAAASESEQHS